MLSGMFECNLERLDSFVEQYASSVCSNSIESILMRIVLPSAVYHIWKERNTRLYTGDEINDKTMLKIIIENVKFQLMCLKVMKSPNVVKIALNWNVEMNFKGTDHEAMEQVNHCSMACGGAVKSYTPVHKGALESGRVFSSKSDERFSPWLPKLVMLISKSLEEW
ncbi:hypothetical protein Tco_0409511 [Tanacetum coccineum]